MVAAFEFKVHHLVPVADAIRIELEAMAFRDGLTGKWLGLISGVLGAPFKLGARSSEA